MMYRVRHTTTYAYSYPVSVCHNALHLMPRQCLHQQCSFHELLIYPEPTIVNQTLDYFGNPVTFFALQEPHDALTMTANSTVEVTPVELPQACETPPWDTVRDLLQQDQHRARLDAIQFVFESPYIPWEAEVSAYALPSFTEGRPLLDALAHLTERIYTDFTYDPMATTVSTPLREVLQERHGVCQDFAHFEIACLRAMGLAARYISGYLVTQPPEGEDELVGSLASHAWLAVYCPGFGWIETDPTNNMMPSDQHITVAYGRDYSDVSPIKGVFLGGGEHALEVAVDVVPIQPA